MATIRKRGESRYLCWSEDGKEYRRSLGQISFKQAEDIRKAKDYELAYGLNLVPGGPPFEIFADQYLEWHKHEFPNSHDRIYQIVNQWLTPYFNSQIGFIKKLEVEDYKRFRSTAKKTPSANTIAKELRTLQAIVNKAVEWELIPVNNIKGVKPPRDNKDAPPPFYEVEEIRDIYRSSLDAVRRATWKMFFNTGFRRGEMLMLKKDYIDDSGIKIISSEESRTKSGKWRKVPHTRGTRQAMRVLAEVDGEFVIPRVQPFSLSRAFGNCLRRAELDGSLHWTRHTYATHLVMNGEPLRKVQLLLGHASIKTTEQYAHVAKGFIDTVQLPY